MSAISLLHKHLDVACPALSAFQVGLMARAVDRTLLSAPRPRLPVSVELLHHLVQATLPLGVWGLVLKCALLLAFFGFLRQSNLAPRAPSQFDPARHSRRCDILLKSTGVFIRLRWSKTLQVAQQPVFIPLPVIDNSPLCPVAAFKAMVACVPTASSKAPLLLLPTTRGQFRIVTIPMLAQEFNLIIQSLSLPLGLTPYTAYGEGVQHWPLRLGCQSTPSRAMGPGPLSLYILTSALLQTGLPRCLLPWPGQLLSRFKSSSVVTSFNLTYITQ